MSSRFLAFAALALLNSALCYAGGPAFVAGSGFSPGVEGQPIVWANSVVSYFTDQGDLSPILPAAQADAFVAAAIAPWTSAPGVSLTATLAGHLAEDVNGSNIQASVSGVITSPVDITSSATSMPLGVVYDYDGSVTDAVLGAGAGSLGDCFSNAVYGGPDNFAVTGNIAHALIIINGVCASASTQLPDVQYRLVRILGRVFGLGWSQANLNVQTGKPAPTADDYAGFPVMHFLDPAACVPISRCYPNAAVPKVDDISALARLYPASGGNPQPAGRVWGNVYFTDKSGNATQQMQGVNVVARLMVSGQPSRQFVVTAVSGNQFVGDAGNIINGYVDENGLRFDRFGSNDTSLEGFYDLGQLTIPTGQTIAQYQLSVEPIDTTWSWGIEPYGPTQVGPSGSFAPVVVTVVNGSNAERDILMLGSAIAQTHPGSGSTYSIPAALPQGGGWGSWVSGYGATDWFQFTAQANRTASVAVTALDEGENPTESKLLPIIGMWVLSDQTQNPAPASTPTAFNSLTFGTTRLDVAFAASDTFRLGIADARGDGRPDFFYQASLLYSDTVTPSRLSVAGGVTTLQGIGFNAGLQVSAAGKNAFLLSQSATQMQVALPFALHDGPVTIQVKDPVSGSFSRMLNALTYGAAATDLLSLLQGGGQTSPLGGQAPSPIRVRATASDGITLVNGATIAWSATNGAKLSVCNGTASCSVVTDQSGEASTWVTPTALGQTAILAALAPASYSPAQTQQALVIGTASTLDLAAITPTRWIAEGATLAIPLLVEALNMGAPQAGIVIKFTVTNGAAALSSSTASTNSAGIASVTAQVTNLSSTLQVSACVTPSNSPCQTFTLFGVPPSSWNLEAISGTSQIVPGNQPFQPLVVRVTDGAAADDPVMGVTVAFLTMLERNQQGPGAGPPQSGSSRAANGMPVILGTSSAQVVTDANGLASIVPTVGSTSPCNAYLTVAAGSAFAQFELQSLDPITLAPVAPTPGGPIRHRPVPRPPVAFGWGKETISIGVDMKLFSIPPEGPVAEPTPGPHIEPSQSVAFDVVANPAHCNRHSREESDARSGLPDDPENCGSERAEANPVP